MADADSKAKKREYQKAYYAENRARYRKHREANREKMREYLKEYYENNKAGMNAQARENYRANADAYKKRAQEWKAHNPERFKEMRARAYAANRERNRERGRRDWQNHNEKRRAAKAEYRQRFPEIGAHFCRLRQTRKQMATPPWADLGAIKAVYAEAARLKKETGTAWHVDHDIPLKHPLVCGLHVHTNLRVIPGPENQSKGNQFVLHA
jgi:hypothetical protein